jgi:hypothetical protein
VHGVNITVDCDLNASWLHGLGSPTLLQLLAKGQVQQHAMPLEALIAEEFGLTATPDYPLAAIAAHADGVSVDGRYCLRADPVHLVLQRDCFSLHESFPLPLSQVEAQALVASLNQHFSRDGLHFMLGASGACYLLLNGTPQIQTTLPSVALDKNSHDFLPQGNDASYWLALLNEVQMLLHEHPINLAREAAGQLALNSLWFSAGGALPSKSSLLGHQASLMANSKLYEGMAKIGALPYAPLPASLAHVLQQPASTMRLHLPCTEALDALWLTPLWQALKHGKISQLTLNLGFYERLIQLNIRPRDVYKFWRRPRALQAYWS